MIIIPPLTKVVYKAPRNRRRRWRGFIPRVSIRRFSVRARPWSAPQKRLGYGCRGSGRCHKKKKDDNNNNSNNNSNSCIIVLLCGVRIII